MSKQDEAKTRRELDHRLHTNINERQRSIGAWEKSGQDRFEHYLYEGKRMIDELRRLPILFQREREGALPLHFKYCSMSPTEKLPERNELICCLGVKTSECGILRDTFNDTGNFPPEIIDQAKAHICTAHILHEEFSGKRIDTSEGYITEATERAFWQRTYAIMSLPEPAPECEECSEAVTPEDVDDSSKVGTVLRCRACLVKIDATLAKD